MRLFIETDEPGNIDGVKEVGEADAAVFFAPDGVAYAVTWSPDSGLIVNIHDANGVRVGAFLHPETQEVIPTAVSVAPVYLPVPSDQLN